MSDQLQRLRTVRSAIEWLIERIQATNSNDVLLGGLLKQDEGGARRAFGAVSPR